MDIIDINALDTLFRKYVLNGGILMWVLIPCSLLMVGAVIQGLIMLRRGRVLPGWITRQALEVKDEATRRAFLERIRANHSPLARILWTMLKETAASGRLPERAALESRLEDAIIGVTDKMYELVGLLATIYTVGPLLGLVGTILGLMDTFHSYAAISNPTVAALSEGVQKALVTTFWGLSMAIPAFVAGQWIQKKIRAYERDEFPAAVWRVIDALYFKGEPRKEPEPEPHKRQVSSILAAAKPVTAAEN